MVKTIYAFEHCISVVLLYFNTSQHGKISVYSYHNHYFIGIFRIMMLTVMKNTKSPVKFWFLKNYLSPTFQVQMLTYFHKNPSILVQSSEMPKVLIFAHTPYYDVILVFIHELAVRARLVRALHRNRSTADSDSCQRALL